MVWPPPRFGRALRGSVAISLWMAAGQPAQKSVAGPGTPQAATGYQLAAQLPARIHQGEPASLILRVEKGGRPVDDVTACLATAPLFASEEDAADTTPALGVDLGENAAPASQAACVMAMAAVRTGPGVYRFTWEPDTAGRVNLRFTAGDSQLDLAVNVASAPPNAAILIAFVVLVGLILSAAAWMRNRQQRQGGAT